MTHRNLANAVVAAVVASTGLISAHALADDSQKQLQQNLNNANEVSKRLEQEREAKRQQDYNKRIDQESGVSQRSGVGVGVSKGTPTITYTQPMDKKKQ